jgi:hypothetical protein
MLSTSSHNGDIAGHNLENCFLEYLAVILSKWWMSRKPANLCLFRAFLILERAKIAGGQVR